MNESNLFVLERAGDLASLSSRTEDADAEEKSDEIPSELLIPDSIPEIDETDEDDDLIPIAKDESATKTEIQFKKKHFKRNSSLSNTSSSSEESLSKGLQFPEHTAVDGPSQKQIMPASTAEQTVAADLVALALRSQQAIMPNAGAILPNIVSNIVQWGLGANNSSDKQQREQRVVTALDSSDDSDFEILESEDFK